MHPMLFLRTAAGGFVDAATIVRLCDEPTGDEIGRVAICDDDREVALAAYHTTPGRLKDLQHLLPPQRLDRHVKKTACRSLIAPAEVVIQGSIRSSRRRGR